MRPHSIRMCVCFPSSFLFCFSHTHTHRQNANQTDNSMTRPKETKGPRVSNNFQQQIYDNYKQQFTHARSIVLRTKPYECTLTRDHTI